MLRIKTQKCPSCGYVFQQRYKLYQPEPGFWDEIEHQTLQGDKAFETLVCSWTQLLACPKCGTILLSSIAESIEKIEED